MLSSLLLSVLTWFVVVRCDTGGGWLWAIKVALKPFVLSRCDNNTERGGTTNVVLVDGYEQFCWICL